MLRRREIGSVELSQHFLDRIERYRELNAFITVDQDLVLRQAEAADKLLSSTECPQLTGLPLAHKDIFCTDGLLTTCGSRMLSDFVAPYNATVVERLNTAGAIILGKTNMDEFAMGSSNENSHFGAVHNPWNTDRVPGGSSGGSAAAVAARLAPAATGTDTGGSIRQPAAFCGLTGLKPSYGRVSRYGMVAYASSLDQGGPITRTAEDAALLLQAMAGFDPRDSTSLDLAVPDYTAALTHDITGLRIGVVAEFFDPSLDQDVHNRIRTALAEFEKLGAHLVDVSLPNSAASVPCYYVIAPAEASSNLSRFDGVRYGYRSPQSTDVRALYENTRAEGFGLEVKRRVLVGTYALSSGYYEAYYLKAQQVRRRIADDFAAALSNCDVLVGPTTPTTAFMLGENMTDPVSMYLNDIFTVSVNLAGLPAISIPAGFDASGLPVGMQLIGNYMDEATLLGLGHQFQQATDWHKHIPGDMI
ncbi:MAG: Asp-tRNA(Asn)/Glu-tRNA(Gln) amidotransferase subunit GatA [Pseudomonadota bacterium]|nr:Asp-tRNA(Asn)/Glu-tRNA(Gln) amidotransferase subunit GatA [Pseudomonadota bacterium]